MRSSSEQHPTSSKSESLHLAVGVYLAEADLHIVPHVRVSLGDVVLDLDPPGKLSSRRQLTMMFPSQKVAVLLSDFTPENQSAVHANGASFCVSKDHLEENLARIIASERDECTADQE